MKAKVWKNKSNGQLCITIAKNSGVREGDLVEVDQPKVRTIAYSGVVADMFHYGHLNSLLYAASISDFNVCGILTDKAVEEYRARPIANLEERKAIVSNLKCVDRVMVQKTRDPTQNLKKLHEEFPEAEIILVHGSDLKYVHGSEYITQINGKVMQHPYYDRLSTYKILNRFLESGTTLKDITNFTSYIAGKKPFDTEDKRGNKMIVSTKAETLKALMPLVRKSRIEKMYIFTTADWKNQREQILRDIKESFAGKIIVRSSAVNEDTLKQSLAGNYQSVLNVNPGDEKSTSSAINAVLDSYAKGMGESSFNQILVQQQTENIAMSGVVFTYALGTNAPYYVINYDSTTKSTDSVTAGRESQSMMIFRKSRQYPAKMQRLMEAVKELEELIPGLPLDIEFAIAGNKESVVLFQVRPLAANINEARMDDQVRERISQLKQKFSQLSRPVAHLEGSYTIFADMPDWNPAEIIGDNPHYLDFSLYDYLITDSAWHEARTSQGYFDVSPAKLVELFGNKPYVNVRNTFNSFTPATISKALRGKLIAFYLEKLKKQPELYDKVEFDILFTCYDLDYNARADELLKNGFSKQETESLKQSLISLTNNLVLASPQSIRADMDDGFSLKKNRDKIALQQKKETPSPMKIISDAKLLLDDCRKLGTVQFSRLARLAFIAKIILKSLVSNKIVSKEWEDNLLASISTVATDMKTDFEKLAEGSMSQEDFVEKYSHLRPGSYDITSPRYGSNPDLISTSHAELKTKASEKKRTFKLIPEDRKKIDKAFIKHGLTFNAGQFMEFVKAAISSRELSKFEFTKNLSDAIELLAEAGMKMGFTRQEIAMLDINEIFEMNNSATNAHQLSLKWKERIKTRTEERGINNHLLLPSILFSADDFDIVRHHKTKPNFVTQKSVEAEIIEINNSSDSSIPDIEGKIVLIENGDPGYDWIFTREIKGLITKYGGAASHMTIRCAEFSLPAAIGSGGTIYSQLQSAKRARLDCKGMRITVTEAK